MTLEEAIKTALEYERKIRDIYENASEHTSHDAARRIYGILGQEEQTHVDYLAEKLKEWRKTGAVTIKKLKTAVPSYDAISDEESRIKTELSEDDLNDEKRTLSKALRAEIETSEFYKKIVEELPPEGKELFAPFIEIEDRHINAVQAELDYVSKTGFWFDCKEFDMEGW